MVLSSQLAIALGDAAADASRLAATPASDELEARRLTAAVQASLAAARASMRDLELFAEEQDTCVLSFLFLSYFVIVHFEVLFFVKKMFIVIN